MLPQLVKHFPESFERFINPFMGGGAIGFSLREGQRALLNDMNLEIVDLYTVI